MTVLSLAVFLKDATDEAVVHGSSFQIRGAATMKARSPIVELLVRGTNTAVELEYRRPPPL